MTKEAVITVQTDKYRVEVANTVLRRAWGLSLRSKGKMLFKFSKPTKARIDMMMLSKTLWLYFLNSEKQVISIQKAEPWTLNPKSWKLYSPDNRYSYLIESFEKLQIEEGDTIQVEYK